MDLGIAGKVAVVCAASEGLGFAVASRLAKEGAKVAICARRPDVLAKAASQISQSGGDVYSHVCNVTNTDQLVSFLEGVRDNLGSPDILVLNAGGPPPGTFETLSDAQWRDAFELTQMSAVYMVRQVLSDMKEKNWGRILFMTSISVKQPIANLMLSNSIRAAVTGMAKTLADEVSGSGVLVNCLCPGLFKTGRMEQVIKSQAEASEISFEERMEAMHSQIPVGRLGDPDEFADFASFLVSERASFVTGSTFWIDGGMYRGIL